MKKLSRNTSHFKFFAVIALIFSFINTEAQAASSVAVVNSITGRAFVSIDGRTQSLKQGDEIEAFSEVFTEVGAQVTLSDYYDHKYHLAGSGHIQFLNKSIELKEGYLWVQSYQDGHTFGVQTANALATFKRAEGIVSFDSFSGRSQLLVTKGQWNYANAFNQVLSQTLSEGQFSFIHMDQDNGSPRIPTPIGYQSFQRITSLFQNIESKQPVQLNAPAPTPARQIASEVAPVIEMHADENAQPKVVSTVDPAMESQLMKLYEAKLAPKKTAPKKWKPTYENKSKVTVRVFGSPKQEKKSPAKTPMKKQRAPASVSPASAPVSGDAFESKLMQEYKNQMRHSSETNKLINELKSFQQDYVQGY